MVEPIAQRLGADLAIGTQVEIVDGKYTGEIIFYAYGEGKAEAVHSLAIDHGFDLAECFAYSDSHTDLPMLEAVGNPRAVNPDSELRAIATERGWEILDFAKPVSMKAKVEKRQALAAGAGVALSAVAVGITWYALRRNVRLSASHR
jgi:phosphoserine phosphatase